MESIKEIYKIGYGPSSSHTMGPAIASKIFLDKNKDAKKFKCVLFGSLALTGKGHLTDYIIKKTFNNNIEIEFDFDTVYKYHPNAMKFYAYDESNKEINSWLVFSVGGGSLKEHHEVRDTFKEMIYPHSSMNEILDYTEKMNMTLVDYVLKYETNSIKDYLLKVLLQMKDTLNKGLFIDGVLPGGLNVVRKACSFYQKYLNNPSLEALTYAYALAISEENASGGMMVTAPTCGSCGVVPAALLSYQLLNNISDEKIIEALMVAGLIGNIVKTNASISGAEVGCQGEVGVACSMASAAMAYLTGQNNKEIEYAAEIALEHHLGMTCDPVDGLVQIPCIERNAVAAMQAHNVSKYVEFAGGEHFITLDSVIEVMEQTGKDLHDKYRETSKGGLALYKKC